MASVTGEEPRWYVYIVRCKDTTLYTGMTTDVAKRVHAHNHRKSGARYTRKRRPVVEVYTSGPFDRHAAAREEKRIKKLTKLNKERLVSSEALRRKVDHMTKGTILEDELSSKNK